MMRFTIFQPQLASSFGQFYQKNRRIKVEKTKDMDGTISEGDVPAEIRREQILTFIKARDFARVADLSARFRVSEVTVRGDLDVLAERGEIRRIRGGAMSRPSVQMERPFEEMKNARASEKSSIGRLAASLISSGETLILDVGTTTTEVARSLMQREDLRDIIVFTNSLNIALELEEAIPRFTVVLTGGTLRPLQHSLVDPLGMLIFDRIKAHTVFLGCNGIDPVFGVTNINLPETEVKRHMLRSAKRRILVADGSKIGKVELANTCNIDEIDLLITDSSADPAILGALRESGLEIMIGV
ncbi:MAG: DeoR/GlpR transcriptional regulator [Ktedonobacteraceae bacterium]|nr:DeoR/GlpR transcriptional regulator [Ktedonobacteraceae bacterium]